MISMKAIDLFNDAINEWGKVNGIGTMLIPPPLEDKAALIGVLQRIYVAYPTVKILVICETWNERVEVIEYLTSQKDEDNNKEFTKLLDNKTLCVYTYTITSKLPYNLSPYLTILFRPKGFNVPVQRLLNKSKFKLVIFNKLPTDNKVLNDIYKVCPLLDSFKQNKIDEFRTSRPIEETQIGIDIPEDSEEGRLLKYYNEYITTSLNIFGSFDIMEQARQGNNLLNISAATICNDIAAEHGWNEHLDMSIEINQQLDELFNPGNIRDRASKTYDIIRDRAKLLSDYAGKLQVINQIIEENPNDKVLVINKRGDFANRVTEYLNANATMDICGNHHPKIELKPAVDIDGNPILYKSGEHKGERKMMGEQAQKTLNEQRFNANIIRVLSLNNMPDKNLNVTVDTIIITSPQCEDIKAYLYRLSKVFISGKTLKLFTIYIKNSIEQQKIDKKSVSDNHVVITDRNKTIYENNSDFVIVE